MSWEDEVRGLEERRKRALEQGGPAALEKQHAQGRLSVRERIDALVDRGSFREQGPIAGASERDERGDLVGFSPANYVLGMARVEGRPIVVGGEDFTLRGGSPSADGLRKSVFAEELALRLRLPLLRLLEGGGGSVAGARVPRQPPAPDSASAPPRFLSLAQVMASAPVVSAALGAVAGFPAARLVASHLAIMTRSSAQ